MTLFAKEYWDFFIELDQISRTFVKGAAEDKSAIHVLSCALNGRLRADFTEKSSFSGPYVAVSLDMVQDNPKWEVEVCWSGGKTKDSDDITPYLEQLSQMQMLSEIWGHRVTMAPQGDVRKAQDQLRDALMKVHGLLGSDAPAEERVRAVRELLSEG